MAGIVKATVESTLGALGTVGAMAVDEFVSRLKTALSELVSSDTAKSPVLGEDMHIGGMVGWSCDVLIKTFVGTSLVCSELSVVWVIPLRCGANGRNY